MQFSHLLLLDKKTGSKLFDDTFPNMAGNYCGLNLNLTEGQWDLPTYCDRIRVVGAEPPVGD